MNRIVQYTPTVRVTPSGAFHDRFQITLGTWIVSDTLNDSEDYNGTNILRLLTHHISPPIEELRNHAASQFHGVVFNRVGRADRGVQPLEFRHDGVPVFLRADCPPFPPTLASGRMSVQANRHGREVHLHCDSSITLNALRYMRQRRAGQPSPPHHLRPFADIFQQPFPDEVNGEWSLDGNNNWLPADERGRVTWTSSKAFNAPIMLVDRLRQRIDYEIQKAISAARISDPTAFPLFSSEIRGRLKQLETCFEFFHNEPLRFVEAVASVAAQYAARVRVRRYELNTEHQSLSVAVQLRAGVLLRVYAKTNRRVRFEIQHNLEETAPPFRGPQRFANSHEFNIILERLRSNAADAVNQFLAFLNLQPLHPVQQHSPLMLVVRVCDAAGSYSQALALLEQLCVSGRVVLSESNPLHSLIRRLADRHLREPVLENRPRTAVYRLTRPWHHARRILARDGQLARIAMPGIRLTHSRADTVDH